MKKMIAIAVIGIFTLTSCQWQRIRGDGSIKTETRDVAAFEAISCDGGYEVQIDCQEKQSLSIETDENLLPLIKTEVHNKTLHVYTKGMLFPSNRIRIAVTVPNLTEFTTNGSTDSDINKVNNDALEVNIHGSGKMYLNGKSGTVKFSTSGSSKIDATSLISENSDIQINGSGNIQVYATNSIDVQINGSGTVKYRGDPKKINQQINGSGRIVRE
jgi:biopolymer transport protein ExbD